LVFLISTCTYSLHSQVINKGILHIEEATTLYVAAGSFTFGPGSSTQTSRTAGRFGKLQLSNTATLSGASSSLFVNGFVSTKSNSFFELPTGQGATYAPIGITNASVTNGVDAAYYEGALTSTVHNATISALPTAGYWDVEGDNATLTLKWSNDISSLTNSIANLTVAGLKISNATWEAIPSAIATGSLTSGSIATSAAVTLANYSAFTLAKRGISCAPVFSGMGNLVTFDGTSWDMTPTADDFVSITGSGSPGSFVCNELMVNANITLIDGETIEVVNDINGSGTITMSSTSSILQRNDASTIAPQIVLTKSSRAGMRANDYIYWGSPLTTNSYSQLDGARAYEAGNAIVGTAAAFDNKFKYVSGDATATGAWQPLTQTEPGKGFIMRIKDQSPYSSSAAYAGHINLTFTGAANNGVVTVATANDNANSTTSARNNNLLANPYPSAIDADKFLEYNTNLDGVIYLWNATTPNSGAEAYSNADYIAYTRAGSTKVTGTTAASGIFDGKIATGQGFKVKALDATATGTAFFNNCMRVSGSNTQFMRMNATASNHTIDRFIIKISDGSGAGNQVLVAYMPEASLAYDRLYDASLNTVSPVQMYSILDNDTKKLAINARPDFDIDDQVTIGYELAATDAAVLNINVVQKEGVFADASTPIYLHDTALNVYHNFNNGAYTFTTATQQDNNRFKIVYQSALSSDAFSNSSAVALLNQSSLQINATTSITQVAVYDITGRLVLTAAPNNSDRYFAAPFNHAEGIYIVKIKLDNGAVATQKLINRK
jgi:hypothetical protein